MDGGWDGQYPSNTIQGTTVNGIRWQWTGISEHTLFFSHINTPQIRWLNADNLRCCHWTPYKAHTSCAPIPLWNISCSFKFPYSYSWALILFSNDVKPGIALTLGRLLTTQEMYAEYFLITFQCNSVDNHGFNFIIHLRDTITTQGLGKKNQDRLTVSLRKIFIVRSRQDKMLMGTTQTSELSSQYGRSACSRIWWPTAWCIEDHVV